MASAAAPYLVTSSISSSLSHHPSPAPSSSSSPASPASSTSSSSPRKRKRDEFLAAPEPLALSPPPSLTVQRDVSAPSNSMYGIQLFSSFWTTLKCFVGIETPASHPEEAVDEAPESPQKRARVEGPPSQEGPTSDDQPNKEEPIVPAAPAQAPNKEASRSQANSSRAPLKIKAPASMGTQTPSTQQLPSPLASSSEDEGESVFKKSATAKPVRPIPPRMAQIFPASTASNPLEQGEKPFFAKPLRRKRNAEAMLQRALARREAHSYRPPLGNRFPIHLQRSEIYKSMAYTPLGPSKVGRNWVFTPAKQGSPQQIWSSMRAPQTVKGDAPGSLSRAARLAAHKGRVQKRVRESYARSQQRSQAETESLEVLLKQLIADKAQGFHSYEEVARRRRERAEDVKRMQEADTKVETIPPLTPDQVKVLKKTITEVNADYRLGRSKIYIEKFKIPISTQDLERVPPGRWLNDEVINFYFQMIVERSKQENPGAPQRVLAHNTYFFTKLDKGGYKPVARWASRLGVGGKALLDLDYMFIPVHVGNNHWCLAVVNFKLKRFEYYDSLGGNFTPQNRAGYYKKLREYVEAETGTSCDAWTDYSMPAAPQQKNTSDCGAFTVKTAECIARGGKITFGDEEMPLIRHRIMLEVLQGSLLPWVAED